MPTPNITRRHALATGAAGAAVLLAGSVGAAAAAVTRPRRRPSGAWYVNELQKIGVFTTCGLDGSGKPKNVWYQDDERHWPGCPGFEPWRYERKLELKERMLSDPTSKRKMMRHLVTIGRGWREPS